MVFVFGIDIPLVELIFVLTLVLILLFGFMVYLVISQIHLGRKLKMVINKEKTELNLLKNINVEEKRKLSLIAAIRAGLDRLFNRTPKKKAKKKVVPRIKKRRAIKRAARKTRPK